MADDFDVSKYLQGISVGAPDSSFDSDGFNTDLFGSSSGSGFNDEGFNIDFLNDLKTGDISKYSGSGFDDDGFNIDYYNDLFSNTPKKDDKNFLEKMFGGVGSALGSAGTALGLGGGKSSGIGGSGISPLQGLLALGGASYLKDRGAFDPKVPVVGYKGKIPEYQYVQEQVTGRDDSDRRSGSGGRRYMSDGIYAKAPENREPMSVAEAKAKAKTQAQGFAEGGDVAAFLQGMAEGGYLNGDSDGQADEVPGSIDGVQEARLSHGEYVLPADLVSLLGNGNSDAGAKALDDFMAMVRKQGTGTEKQQKNIKADKVLASLMKGKG